MVNHGCLAADTTITNNYHPFRLGEWEKFSKIWYYFLNIIELQLWLRFHDHILFNLLYQSPHEQLYRQTWCKNVTYESQSSSKHFKQKQKIKNAFHIQNNWKQEKWLLLCGITHLLLTFNISAIDWYRGVLCWPYCALSLNIALFYKKQ